MKIKIKVYKYLIKNCFSNFDSNSKLKYEILCIHNNKYGHSNSSKKNLDMKYKYRENFLGGGAAE